MFETVESREIGPYVVHELIGWGGMAHVYRATDTSRNDRDVAVKVISESMMHDPDIQRRFVREIATASTLDHPYILPLLDYGRAEGVLFMVMPLVREGTLGDRLRDRGPLTPRRAVLLADQIGAALDYAHSEGMIHRDIKPHNIMMVARDRMCLADFGLVKFTDDVTAQAHSSNAFGSPMYMSPEQAQGHPLDWRTDLYSLGLVLYEALLDRPPYIPRTPMDMIAQHVTHLPVPPHRINPAFPPALEAVLLRAIEKTPIARYQSGRELSDAISRACERLPASALDRPLASPEQIDASRALHNEPVIRPISREITGWMGSRALAPD